MVFFINERSLEPYVDSVDALKLCLKAMTELRHARVDGCALHRDSAHFLDPAFRQRFNNLALPRDVKASLRELVFSERHYPCWRPHRLSDPTDTFACEAPAMICADETLAEAGRRAGIAETPVLLLTSEGSAFDGRATLDLARNAVTVQVALATTEEQIRAYLAAQPGQYDPTAGRVPQDSETVLAKNPARFTYIGKVEFRRKRRVYEETGTGRLFHVDNGHPGQSAHLEVYTGTRVHVGTADIHEGTVDTSTCRAGRRLRF